MNFSDLRVLLDLLIVGLLVGTVIHATMLNRNLNRLRNGRAELDGLVQSLSESVVRAEAAIQGMKRSAAECGGDLQKQIAAARSLSDELHIMNESGNNLAHRLEKAARVSRVSVGAEEVERPAASSGLRAVRPERLSPVAASAEPVVPFAPGDGAHKPKMASVAERELIAAIETARRGAA
jgi:hypothetical protein